MNSSALVMMILIILVVWGGFALCLRKALQRERKRQRSRN